MKRTIALAFATPPRHHQHASRHSDKHAYLHAFNQAVIASKKRCYNTRTLFPLALFSRPPPQTNTNTAAYLLFFGLSTSRTWWWHGDRSSPSPSSVELHLYFVTPTTKTEQTLLKNWRPSPFLRSSYLGGAAHQCECVRSVVANNTRTLPLVQPLPPCSCPATEACVVAPLLKSSWLFKRKRCGFRFIVGYVYGLSSA